MLSLDGIAIRRRLSGVESGMHAGIERMHGGIVWEVLGLQLLTLSLDVFAQFVTTEGLLNRTGLDN